MASKKNSIRRQLEIVKKMKATLNILKVKVSESEASYTTSILRLESLGLVEEALNNLRNNYSPQTVTRFKKSIELINSQIATLDIVIKKLETALMTMGRKR